MGAKADADASTAEHGGHRSAVYTEGDHQRRAAKHHHCNREKAIQQADQHRLIFWIFDLQPLLKTS